MKVTQQYDVSGRELFVIDGCFSKAEIGAIERRMVAGPHHRKQSNRPDTLTRAFSMHFDVKPMLETIVGDTTVKAVKSCFPGEKILPYKFYCNMGLYGDSAYTHRDCSEWERDITALVYANSRWEPEWGGETLFYNDQGDCVAGVSPKPGRIAVFRAAMVHRPGIAVRDCYMPRFTLACKFRGLPVKGPKDPWATPCGIHKGVTCGCRGAAPKKKTRAAAMIRA